MAKILPFPASCPADCPDGTVRPLPFDLDQEYHFSLGVATQHLAKPPAKQPIIGRFVSSITRLLRAILGQRPIRRQIFGQCARNGWTNLD